MSFSQQVKAELCHLRPAGCCKFAECYGMLLFGRSFSNDNISFLSSDREVVLHLAELIKGCFGAVCLVSEGGVKKPTYLLSVDNPVDIKRILIKYDRYGNKAVMGINRTMFDKECCIEAFIRGAFLACGSINDPEKSFHAEFALKKSELTEDFIDVLKNRGLSPKNTVRQGRSVIYFKNGADIEDLLTVMNATVHTLELMNVQIYKDMRNKINRQTNCDNANINRTINVALKQIKDIELIAKTKGLDSLSDELRQVAELRLEDTSLSLKDIGESLEPPISRSGVNHRLMKIAKIADEIRNSGGQNGKK